MKLKLQNL